MSLSTANAATTHGVNPDSLNFKQLISSWVKSLAATGPSNVKSNISKASKSFNGYELWSPKLSIIFEVMYLDEIVVSGIDPLPVVSAEEFNSFQLAQG
jgi:hypothetical protein